MSHSFQADNGTRFFFNPDLSGDVTIKVRKPVREFNIPGMAIAEFGVAWSVSVRHTRESDPPSRPRRQVLVTADGTRFSYHPRLVGVVRVNHVLRPVEYQLSGLAIIQFFADYVRSRRVAELERAEVFQILGIPKSALPVR